MEQPAPKPTPPRRAAFIHSPLIQQYHYPPDCPFRTERARLTHEILLSTGLLSGPNRREVAPQPAERQTLLEFHAARYLDAMRRAERGELDPQAFAMGLGSPDCPVFKGMYEYAALACGASLTGAELILSGQADVAFNPSGGFHHARPAMAAGFCYLNDVVLACLRLAEAYGRVLYLDLDAHHGDGVQEAFYARRDVMTISFHESGKTLFPGTGWTDEVGTGEGTGYSVNVPLPPDTYDEAFLKAFRAVAAPLMAAYRPQAVVLEVGMDGLAGDPLAHLALTNNAYAEAVQHLADLGCPVLAAGGGGYHPRNTARGWALVWSVLCGEQADQDDAAGLGGVMLQTTDWRGGLRDRVLAPDRGVRDRVDPVIQATIEKVKANVFRFHGL